jgi:glycosidase
MKQFILVLLLVSSPAWAQLANVWHIPGSTQTGIPSTMRDETNPGANRNITFYQGVWKGDGANQTGGTFSYRIDGGAWQNLTLSLHSNEGTNQFWKASVTMPALPGMVIDYYFAPTFDNRTSPTYLHGSNQTTSSLATAQGAPTSFTLGEGDPLLTVNGTSANYTTSKLFVDEIAGDSIPLNIEFKPGQSNVTQFEIYTNLNRRDRADVDANADGYPDGVSAPNGATITAGDDSQYFKAYTMTGAGSGAYTLTLPAEKTGAYRLTARWKVSGDPVWRWYTNGGANRRDHAITVSPKDARDIRLYEINVLNIEATDDTFANRSTLEDMHNATGAPHNANNRWDLDYLKNLGLNWLWFQPIHPPARDGREPSNGWGNGGLPYEPGSPYAVKNFFEVSPIFTKNFSGNPYDNNDLLSQTNRDAAMSAWQNFVTAADTKQVGIMLDAPFNHTAFDVELAQAGVDLFQPDGQTWSKTDEIRNRDARFFSLDGNYGNRASNASNIAAGPDRFDFGKWNDVKDVFFGRYDALVEYDSEPERSSFTSEGDWFDATDTDWTNNDFVQGGQNRNVTRRVWQYFAKYGVHWLEKTRPSGQNRNSDTEAGLSTAQRYAWDSRGIDGLRCDFGQGLPPQCWEYIINSARSKKWNFVMMSESLDGGNVTYRANRHFDILNENIVFPLASATTNTDYRNIFESRRNTYGLGLVLINNTSHDEANYTDPWEALIRYSVASSIDGAPLIFPGQELGISATYGYNHYELNFGKYVPHFKRFNSMQPIWNDADFGNDQLYPVYAGMGAARANSPALRSSNRWFLDGDGSNNKIHAVAKYETANASLGVSDVVLAFSNLDRNNDKQDNFKIPSGLATLLGIKDGRSYNVKNTAAYLGADNTRRNQWLWNGGTGYTGSQLKNSGFLVSLPKVPTTSGAWATAPFEAQYLKLHDVTPPPAPSTPAGPNIHAYVVGNTATFNWTAASDPDGGVSGYHLQVGTTPGGSDVFNATTTVTSQAVGGLAYGSVIYARVSQLNNAGIEGPFSSTSAAIEVLDPAADRDGDGQSNAAEEGAGTNPLDASSLLKATAISVSGNDVNITVATVSGKTYQLETSTTLAPLSWTSIGTPITATGPSTVFPHTGGASDTRRFYRARVVP